MNLLKQLCWVLGGTLISPTCPFPPEILVCRLFKDLLLNFQSPVDTDRTASTSPRSPTSSPLSSHLQQIHSESLLPWLLPVTSLGLLPSTDTTSALWVCFHIPGERWLHYTWHKFLHFAHKDSSGEWAAFLTETEQGRKPKQKAKSCSKRFSIKESSR